MSILQIIRDREFNLKARRLECMGYRGHGPWVRLAALDFTKPHECAHCGVRVAGLVKGFTNRTHEQRKD